MFFIKEGSKRDDFVIIHFSEDGVGSLIRLVQAAGKTIFFDVRILSDDNDNLKTIREKKFGKDGIYCQLQENPRKYRELLKVAKKQICHILPATREIEAQITDVLITA